MASSTTFILSPNGPSASSSSSSSLPPSSTLNLLPFSLGPSSTPYTSSTANLSRYFQPRPNPTTTSNPIATFRGRQLVGQGIEVPRGYKGIILHTSQRPDRGGLEHRTNYHSGLPLTPASSAASISSDVASVGSRGAVRGLGQIALSRPKRQAKTIARKRIRLDSDDEDDQPAEAGEDAEENKVSIVRSSSKRLRTRVHMTPEVEKTKTGVDVPAIVVQAPTPRKPRGRTRNMADTKVMVEEVEHVEDIQMTGSEPVGTQPEQSQIKLESGELVQENIVPSPATEDDPPTFPIADARMATTAEPRPTPVKEEEAAVSSSNLDANTEAAGADLAGVEGAVRILEPSSTFSEIILWTPDAPLAGFRANELADRHLSTSGERGEAIGEDEHDNPVPDPSVTTDAHDPAGGKGWWRAGGAGEGGDEFVRSMGEWLGLVEMFNEPVYLDGLDDGDDDLEDD